LEKRNAGITADAEQPVDWTKVLLDTLVSADTIAQWVHRAA
jgi:hypothetical protein